MRVTSSALTALIIFLALSATIVYAAADLVEKAKEEREVIWYTTLSVPESRKLGDMFQKRYPFLEVKVVRTGGGALVNRILSEFSARAHIVDVILGSDSRGGIPVFKQRGVIDKYDFPNRQHVAENLKDKDGYWTSLYNLTTVLAYNTGLVSANDVPKTFDDLLDPKWKGKKILSDTESYAWFGTLLDHWGKEKGLDYFRRLAKQEMVFQRGTRGRIQLVMAGEFPLTIAYGPHIQGYASQGAPIDWVPLEPVVIQTTSVLLAKNARHPAAARLFIDFLFSKEVHEQLREFKRIPSRVDVDPDPPKLFKGFKKIVFDSRIAADMRAIVDLYNETFDLTR